MAQRSIIAQKAFPTGPEELMNDGAAAGVSVGQFTVPEGDVYNVTSFLCITERPPMEITRFRVRKASNAPLAMQEVFLIYSTAGPTSTEFGFQEPRAFPTGTYNITVEQPGPGPKAFAAIQLIGAGNARQ
jgi:hypothetical protein